MKSKLFIVILICLVHRNHTIGRMEDIKSTREKYHFHFLHMLFNNEYNMPSSRFPPSGNYTYVTLCASDELSMTALPSLNCLILALSCLVTGTIYPFTFLISSASIIHDDYRNIMNKLGIMIYLYDEIKIPKAGVDEHINHHQPHWLLSYQRIFMYKLDSYKRGIFLDYDMIIIKNIDHLFFQKDEMMGGDCSPHDSYLKHRTYSNGSKIGSIYIYTPNLNTFDILVNAIYEGTIYSPRNPSLAIGWKWPQTDQTLLPTFINFGQLPCEYQSFPDICLHAQYPLEDFPLHKSYILHYTWIVMKGVDFFMKDSFNDLMMRSRMNISIHELPPRLECWRRFSNVLEHFYLAIKKMNEHIIHECNTSIKDILLSEDCIPRYKFKKIFSLK